MSLSDRIPFHTRRFSKVLESDISDVVRIFTAKAATEKRGQLELWDEISQRRTDRVVWVASNSREQITCQSDSSSEGTVIGLHDSEALGALLCGGPVLVDISGLPHHVWAPILRAASEQGVATQVLYAEPDSYKEHPNPSSVSYFDLSVTFEGLAPLPGFARLSGPPDDEKCLFVALLGFEGNRPSSLIAQVDPMPKVIPFIGVPGFQIEYPAFTVACNREFLDAHRAYEEIRLVRASCPFEVIKQLREVHRDYPDHYLYIAPIGTKPHALGAILYALECSEMTEIMFDHPVRKKGRTSGVGIIHLFDLGRLGAK